MGKRRANFEILLLICRRVRRWLSFFGRLLGCHRRGLNFGGWFWSRLRRRDRRLGCRSRRSRADGGGGAVSAGSDATSPKEGSVTAAGFSPAGAGAGGALTGLGAGFLAVSSVPLANSITCPWWMSQCRSAMTAVCSGVAAGSTGAGAAALSATGEGASTVWPSAAAEGSVAV